MKKSERKQHLWQHLERKVGIEKERKRSRAMEIEKLRRISEEKERREKERRQHDLERYQHQENLARVEHNIAAKSKQLRQPRSVRAR